MSNDTVKLYVEARASGLHTESAVEEELRAAGADVRKVMLIKDKEYGRSKGFGFVDVGNTREELVSIMEKVNARAKLLVNDSPKEHALVAKESEPQPSLEDAAENPETSDDDLTHLMEVGDDAVRIRAIINFRDPAKARAAIDLEAQLKREGWEGVLVRVGTIAVGPSTRVTKEVSDYAFGKIPKETLEDMGY